MRVHVAKESDIAGIRWLLEYEGAATEFLDESSAQTFLVCRDENGVVGAIRIEIVGHAGLLRSLVVASDVRGRGIGGQLSRAAEARARRANVSAIYAVAIAEEEFYGARGYRIIAPFEAPAAIEQRVRPTVETFAAVLMVKTVR